MPELLCHAIIFAKDPERLAGFYERALSLVRGQSHDGYRELEAEGRTQLGLHALPAHVAASIEITIPPGWRGDTAVKLCWSTPDLDATRARFIDAGGLAKDPWTMDGQRRCDCADLEGNVVQLVETATSQ
ncbi:MAG: hypothetical protein K0V04_31115 [Deltaproteobacteria bacterium]|nr:hypothetical protein [Deltaproteobacteria bacterium]